MKKLSLQGVMCAVTIVLALMLGGCGSSGSSTSSDSNPSGVAKASVDVTDASSADYAHVYVTVTGVAFHLSDKAGFSNYSSAKVSGWQIARLPAPMTVDLAQLTNGKTFSDFNSGNSLFSGITLPIGSYGQIRIFLSSTEDALAASAIALGLTYNNEVQLVGDTNHYPLRIPTPVEGIRLIPDSPMVVTGSSNVKLVLDFNLNNDVVEVSPDNATEFILKPRLGYFDMSSVGAVSGTVTSATFDNISSNRVVVKAQQVKADTNYRITRRLTSPDKNTGAFTLYPLPIFGNATTATYDILISGRHLDTAIIKGVKVHKGSTPATGGTTLGSIAMLSSPEFTAQASFAISPTGSWINFYQTIAGDINLYEVRYRHLDPYTGKFFSTDPEPLATGPVQVATYAAGQPITFAADSGTPGVYTAVAEVEGLYSRGAALTNVTGAANANVLMNFEGKLPIVAAPATPQVITTIFDMSFFGTGKGHGMGESGSPLANYPSRGQVFVTQGGMIIDSQGSLTGDTNLPTVMFAGGGNTHPTTLISTFPGGVDGTIYGLYALGWGNGVLAEGSIVGGNLIDGNVTATIKMK